MKIHLNLARDRLEVQLEHEDGISPRSVQRELRRNNVSFVTSDWRGRWEIPAKFILAVSESFLEFDPSWDVRSQDRLARIREDYVHSQIGSGEMSVRDHRLEYVNEMCMSPYEEQYEAAHLMSAPPVNRFALFWKPGSGKTGAMITAGHELLRKGIINGILVVAERPLAMKNAWIDELNRWLPQEEQADRVLEVIGSKDQRLNMYLTDADWVIVHYTTLVTDEYAIKAWAERNEKVERPVVIFDESDYIKNPSTQRSRAAMAVRRECGRCWIASGTPAPNAPVDYEHQLSVLAGYPIDLGFTGERTDDAVIVVHALEKGVYYLQRENPRKMPETTYPIRVDLTAPQRSEYDELSKNFLAELQEMDESTYLRSMTQIRSRRTQLLRLCSDPGFDGLPSPVFDTPAKWPQIDALLASILQSPAEKVVIWTRFRATARALWRRYQEKYGAALMMAGESGSPADLDEPQCRVLVATMQIGSSSINLTAARNAIYESIDDVSRNFVQSMARINRTGQTKDCRYWFMIAKDTIEEDMFENTIAKMQISEDVLEQLGQPGRSQLIEALKRTLNMADGVE